MAQKLLGRLAFRLLRRSTVLTGRCARGEWLTLLLARRSTLVGCLARAPVDLAWLACRSGRATLSGSVWVTCVDPWGR